METKGLIIFDYGNLNAPYTTKDNCFAACEDTCVCDCDCDDGCNANCDIDGYCDC